MDEQKESVARLKLTNGQRKPVVINNGRFRVKLMPGHSAVVSGTMEEWRGHRGGLYGILYEPTEEALTTASGLERREGTWKVTNRRNKPLIMVYNRQHARLHPNQSIVMKGDYFELSKNYGVLVEAIDEEAIKAEEINIAAALTKGTIIVQDAESELE